MPNRSFRVLQGILLALCAIASAHAEVQVRLNVAPTLKEATALGSDKLQQERFGTRRDPNGVRYDQPMSAARFQAWQRSKNPDVDTGVAWLSAKADADALPVFASARNEVIAARSPVPETALDSWTALGPGNVGGRTRTLVFHPNFAANNTLFVGGVAGGIWRSTDGGSTWTPLGDFNPNIAVTSLLIDRTDANRMWAGTGEGVFNVDAVRGAGIFQSTDAGVTWTQIQSTAPITGNTNFRYVFDMAQSPNVATTFYVTTVTGFWRTLDSGATWTRYIDPTAGTASNGCHDIIVRPDVTPNDTVVVSCGNFAPTGTATGIWHSTNANVAVPGWSKRLGPAGAVVIDRMGRSSLAVAPSSSATMYAMVACSAQAATGATACGNPGGTANDNHFDDALRGIYRSTDGGLTWAAQYTNAFSEANTENRELLLSNPLIGRCSLCTTICGIGAGSSFGGQGWYDNVIAVDPLNAARVWVGGIDLWRSDDSGVNWGIASYWGQQYMPGVPLSNYAHADQHGIWFPPNYGVGANRTLYVSNDGGIQRTADATLAVGTSSTALQTTNSICGQANRPAIVWNNLNTGYQVTQFYHGAVFPNGLTYFGGTQDNGTNLRAEGSMSANQWDEINGGDGGYVAVDPTNTNILYSETTGISIDKSTNGGASWAAATTGITDPGGLFINPFLLDPNLNTRLFTSGRSMWRTTNSAGTWTQASTALANRTCGASSFADNFSGYAVAPGDSNLMVMGTDLGRLCRLTNATSSTNATAPACTTPLGANCATISSIAFDTGQPAGTAQNSRIVYATVSDFGFSHVLKSIDGGQTWAAIDNQAGTTARLPDIPAHSILSDPIYPPGERLYVGTDLGVFVTIDSGLNWMRENAGFSNTPIEWMVMRNRVVGTGSAETNPVPKAPATGELFAFTHGRSVFKTSLRAAGRFCSSPGAAIPDNSAGGTTSDIVLTNITNTQTGWIDLDLQLTVAHANIGDLTAMLTRTSGPGSPVSVTLFDRPGVPVTSFCTGAGDNIAAVFDDDADFTAETRCVDANTPSLAGAFRPNGSMSSVVAPGTATYRLTVSDVNAGTTGSLTSWCLVPTANTDATVPVTLGHVTSAALPNGRIDVRFETGASVSVAAIELSASRHERDVFARLPIDADALTVQRHRFVGAFSGDSFWMRVLNVDGTTELKGPFAVGTTRGTPVPEAPPIDWSPVRSETAQGAASRLQRNGGLGAGNAPAVNLLVRADGIQSVSFDDLSAAGAMAFEGVPVAELALTLRGQPVALFVDSADATFGTGDHIEFIGQRVHRPSETSAGFESLYTDALPYRLARDGVNARRIARARNIPEAAPAITSVAQDTTLEDNRIYAYGSPLRDPWAWLRALAFAGAPSETMGNFVLTDIDVAQATRVDVTVHGGNDFPTGGPDHEAVVLLNGQSIGTAVFDGLSSAVVSANLQPGHLQAMNTITLRLPASNGQTYDMVYLEDIRVRYERGLNAADGRLSFVANDGTGVPIVVPEGTLMLDGFETQPPACSSDTCRQITVAGLDAATARVYQGVGSDWYRIDAADSDNDLVFTSRTSAGHRFEIADQRGVHAPDIAPIVATAGLTLGPAEYLVITHPLFADHLGGLLAQRQSDGLTTKLVTTDALYQANSHGLIDPQAIEDYIGFARANFGTRYVLLVGGDTYDYFDDLGVGSVSHVPTRYRPGDAFVRFAPSDNEYADVDQDLVPDVAIGRLPVRTVAELQAVLQKMIAFGQASATTQVFTADASGEGIDFDLLMEEHRQSVTGNAAQVQAYIDTNGLNGARTALVDGINAGARYVAYFGHSSPDRWSYAPLLTAGELNSGLLTNASAPIFVNQLGCWNTFFVSPQANGMAHAWLNNAGGAAAVLGATALIEIGSGHEFGLRVAERLVPGARLGDIVRDAKQDLADDGITANDVLILGTLLGDPAMRY